MLFYLDAGSGSLIAQAFVAGVAGTAVVAKTQWRRLSRALRRRPATPEQHWSAATAPSGTDAQEQQGHPAQ